MLELPELDPVVKDRARGEDAQIGDDERKDRKPEAEPVNAVLTDRVADVVAPEIIDVGFFLNRVLRRVIRAENRAAVHRENHRGEKESGDAECMEWIEIKVLVAESRVRDPRQVAGEREIEPFAPAAHPQRTDDLQRDPRRDGKAEHQRDMIAHLEFSADIDFAQKPCNKGSRRANNHDFPRASIEER